jgi:serine/threonine-protein kinase
MNRFDAVPLPGTEGAHGPFFSPEGDWVAFFAQGSLKKVRVIGQERERDRGCRNMRSPGPR